MNGTGELSYRPPYRFFQRALQLIKLFVAQQWSSFDIRLHVHHKMRCMP